MKITIIVAMNKKKVIGLNNSMPWHLPADLKHFKQLTMGKPIIMGRKTFDSIGKVLPGRENVILSRNPEFNPPNTTVLHSTEQVIKHFHEQTEIMIIGGANIYQQFLAHASLMHITEINDNTEGDTTFPQWDKTQWQEVSRQNHPPCTTNSYHYSFVTYKKIHI